VTGKKFCGSGTIRAERRSAGMHLSIRASLDYQLAEPMSLLLHIEAAHLPEQSVESARLDLSQCDHFARVSAHDDIGERIWLRAGGRFTANYEAIVRIERGLADIATLPAVPTHQLPGEAVQYLLDSLYCPASRFQSFVEAEFGGLEGGARIAAFRDFIQDRFEYLLGSSNSQTDAVETFVKRQGVCRDYAHVLIALSRAAAIPARIASVYATGVDPPDFHAVAEVFLGGEWHLVDPTGMASEGAMAKIGIGRDAADVAFLNAFGSCEMVQQSVSVTSA
jgi:transglutaminase-like putative cysteine protease